jgi:hypothetical protein
VILLVKLPVPCPFVVLLLDIVGLSVVDQQTPLAVTEAPPSVVIFPPEVAVVAVIDETAVVVRVGTAIGDVVNVISFP